MSATAGLAALGDYAGAANDSAAVQILLDMIPNPDGNNGGSGAGAAGGAGAGHLDEMSPGAAAQLRVELLALQNAIDTTNTL